jgi:hypothetical protein
MPVDENKSRELFSDAYVRAVVSASRMHVEARSVDNDSVDGYIHYTGSIGEAYSPQIAFQLKCTGQAAYVREESIAFPLSVKNYRELRVESGVPRILIVVVVPRLVDEWVLQDEDQLRIHRCGYWVSLRGAPPVSNERRRTVHVPRNQPFTREALLGMMTSIGDGDLP